MTVMSLHDFRNTGQFVSAEMFGANAVFSRADGGAPTDAYAEAIKALNVPAVRFGGGQADVAPDMISADGTLPVDGVNAVNVVEMPGGNLRPELVTFLDWCEAMTAAGHPVKATLIIPTKHLDAAAYGAFVGEIETFARKVMQDHGDLIAAFQIGNEYWEMGETAYGQKASLAAVALENGMLAAGLAPEAQPDILVQMATAGNAGSEFPAVPGVSDFVARNTAANETVIAQLSASARDAIDAVTEHYYYDRPGIALPPPGATVKNIDRELAIWEAAFGRELKLHITEWNVKTTTPSQHGMVAASSLIEMFEHMIGMGTDAAHVWALDYHSRTALTLDTDGGVRSDAQGRLVNSPQGAAFDLMAASLVGKGLVDLSFLDAVPGVEVSGYTDGDKAVFYVSARSNETVHFSLDLSGLSDGTLSVSGVHVGMDPQSSNGRQWENGVPADFITLDEAPYYFNEHDVDVLLTDLRFADPGAIELSLRPFEVVELTVDLHPDPPRGVQAPDGPRFIGSGFDDVVQLGADVTFVDAGGGLDTVLIDASGAEARFLTDAAGRPVMILPEYTYVTLDDVERIAFRDGTLALDTGGTSGQVYRLYQASFDRAPDPQGIGFWIGQMDSGAVTLIEMAAAFLASEEFENQAAQNHTPANGDFITLLYENVLDRIPDADGFAFWTALLDNGFTREETLVGFSESAENRAQVAPLIADGIWYH